MSSAHNKTASIAKLITVLKMLVRLPTKDHTMEVELEEEIPTRTMSIIMRQNTPLTKINQKIKKLNIYSRNIITT
jgi:hypothetical protein